MNRYYSGRSKRPLADASTHYRVWIVRQNGTRTDHGIYAKAEAFALARRLTGENPLDMIECQPAGGAPIPDAELDRVFDRIKRGK